MTTESRNLFTTKTLQGAFLMVAGFIIATAPLMNDFIERVREASRREARHQGGRKFDPKIGADLKFYLAMVVVGGGFVRTAIGRYEATNDVYTPQGLPGRNVEDVK